MCLLRPSPVFLAAMLALIAPPLARGQDTKPAISRMMALPTTRPALGEAASQRVTELQKEAVQRLAAGRINEALPFFERIAAEMLRDLPPDWHQVIDAQWELATFRRVAAMTPEERTRFAACGQLVEKMEQLAAQGRAADALKVQADLVDGLTAAFGSEHPKAIEALLDLGSASIDADRADIAERACRSALAASRKTLGDWHPLTLRALNELAYLLYSRGAYAEALPLAQAAADGTAAVLGRHHRGTITSANSLMLILAGFGRTTEADELSARILAQAQEALGENAWITRQVLCNRVQILRARGKLAEAERLARQGMALAPQGRHDAQSLRAMTELSAVLGQAGRLQEAEIVARQVLGISRKQFGDDSPPAIAAMHALVLMLFERGRALEAEPQVQELVERAQRVYGATHPLALRYMSTQGMVLRDCGHLQQAIAVLRKVADASTGAGTLWTESTNYLATALFQAGELAEAENLLRRVVLEHQIARRERDPAALAPMWNLARTLELEEKHEEAGALFTQSLAAAREVLGDDHPYIATHAAELARFLSRQNRCQEAEPLIREALALAASHRTRIVGDEQDRAAYSSHLGLSDYAAIHAGILQKLGRFADALQATEQGRCRELLDLLESGEPAGIASASAQARDAEAMARSTLDEAEAILAATSRREDLREDERQKLQADQSAAVTRARQAWHQARADVLAAQKAAWPEASPASVTEIRQTLERGELLLEFVDAFGVLLVLAVPPAGEGEIEAFSLVEGPALLELVTTIGEHKAWCVEMPGLTRGPVQEAVAKARHEAAMTALRRSHELYKALFPPPLWSRIARADRLIVAPDGLLGGLPLETLVTALPAEGNPEPLRSARFLIDDAPPIAYTPSATVYRNRRLVRRAQLQLAGSRENSVLLLADPAFQRRLATGGGTELAVRGMEAAIAERSQLDNIRLFGGQLRPLPGTRREAESIARLVETAGGNVTVLLGEEATAPRLFAAASGQRFVHLATHGLTGTRARPYDASLALAQPWRPRSDDPGFLRLEDLVHHWKGRLSSTELVVLSACATQRRENEDAAMSLPWGFFHAGAPAVITSLWQVEDGGAAQLMTLFYQRMLAPGAPDKLAAFTDARRTLKKDRPHPYHWAPFIFLGASR